VVSFFTAAGMDKEEGEQFPIFYFYFHYSVNDERIFIWTRLDSEEKTRIISQDLTWMLDSLSFSPDGRFLASKCRCFQKLIIWATEVNKKTERIKMECYFIVLTIQIYST
jgi:hypothetical protein